MFLGFLQDPETAALLPSGVEVSDAGRVWLKTKEYGSWPPTVHVGVEEWAKINTLPPETHVIVLYCRKLADEYRRWNDLRRKRRKIEEDYQRWYNNTKQGLN